MAALASTRRTMRARSGRCTEDSRDEVAIKIQPLLAFLRGVASRRGPSRRDGSPDTAPALDEMRPLRSAAFRSPAPCDPAPPIPAADRRAALCMGHRPAPRQSYDLNGANREKSD